MTVLKAFCTFSTCGQWVDIWKGDKLSDLDRKLWLYFKSFYGIENLVLKHEFESTTADDPCYFGDEEEF